jgi:glycosyltransferase involved in cell wall biosynthesis
MTKILQVLYSGLGGHGTVTFSLFEKWKEDYANHFIFYGVEKINKDYEEKLVKENITSYFGIRKKSKTGLKEWRQYYQYLKQIKPNVIILHSNQLIIPTYLYSLFNKTKIISVEHDAISIRNKRKWIVSNINAILANHIVVLTENYKKHIKNNLWFKNLIYKYEIIPNGVNTQKFSLKSNYFKNSVITFFMASRMNKLRDHVTLIEALKLVHKNSKNIRLRIAGDGETLNPLKKKYQGLDYITFLGNIDQQKIIEELHNADIYIHATFAETFSTAILQAMSCGLPIICSNIEGTRHMIKHNHNGLLYKNKDINNLVKQIEFLINNKEKAINLGKKANMDVKNKYSTIVIEKYATLINSL